MVDHDVTHDGLYELYCKYTESSRVAKLRVTLNPESRRSIAEDNPMLSRNEFMARLNVMSHDVRRTFIRRIILGYEHARTVHQDELLCMFRW